MISEVLISGVQSFSTEVDVYFQGPLIPLWPLPRPTPPLRPDGSKETGKGGEGPPLPPTARTRGWAPQAERHHASFQLRSSDVELDPSLYLSLFYLSLFLSFSFYLHIHVYDTCRKTFQSVCLYIHCTSCNACDRGFCPGKEQQEVSYKPRGQPD